MLKNFSFKFLLPPKHSQKSPRRKIVRFLVILFLITAVFLFFKISLRSVQDVEVTKAVIYPVDTNINTENNVSLHNNTELLFQASGWIEPDPFPIHVTSLYSGVVNEVHVFEGQKVAKGQLIASLVEEDARLAFLHADIQHRQSQAEEEIIEADIELAKASLDGVIANLVQEKVLLEESKDSLKRLEALPLGAVSEQNLYRAKFASQKQEAALGFSSSQVEQQESMIKMLRKKLSAQKKTTDLYNVKKQIAELDLNRTEIRSPINGIVLRLLAKPGGRMMLHMDDMDAASAAILYEEGNLQARIDVPLNEAAKIYLGQPVEIVSSILPEKVFNGKVTRILGEADLQRNTLQVKVSLLQPDPKLRPEMLCRAKFFSQIRNDGQSKKSTNLFVNKDLKSTNNSSVSELFVISKDGRHVEKRKVVFGKSFKGEFQEVLEGLLPGDQIVLNPPSELKFGDRVKIVNIK